jgi:ATP-dependent protease ClpP protease subunit
MRKRERTPKRRHWTRIDDDDDEGFGSVRGRNIVWSGSVGSKFATFLWTNLLATSSKIDIDGGTPKEKRKLILNSCGGCLGDMLSIIDLFEEIDDLTTVATGSCMSAAVPIIAAGTPGKRFATWRTRFMLHPAWNEWDYPIELTELSAEYEEFKKNQSAYNAVMARYTKHTKRWWDNKLLDHQPWYFSAKEAKEHGIIDEVIPDPMTTVRKPRKKRGT